MKKLDSSNERAGFSIITVTKKRDFFKNILANYTQQKWNKKELIIVLNWNKDDLLEWSNLAKNYPNVSVYQLDQSHSLGACLNYAISKCKHPFVAKFDDDDYYAPLYLSGMYRAFARSGASVVGKRSYYTYIQKRRLLIERFPNHQNQSVQRVAGATLTMRKSIFKHLSFDNVSFGEDVRFLNACRRKGLRIYSNNKYNYVCIRRQQRKYHTWHPSDRQLMRGSKIIARTFNYKTLTESK